MANRSADTVTRDVKKHQITQGGAEVLTAALQDGTVTRHTDIRTGEPILMTLDLRGAGLLKGRPRFLRDKRRAFRYV